MEEREEFLVKIDCTEAGSWMFQLVEKYIFLGGTRIFLLGQTNTQLGIHYVHSEGGFCIYDVISVDR